MKQRRMYFLGMIAAVMILLVFGGCAKDEWLDTPQEHWATSRKVNSAIDNPSSYYTAASDTIRPQVHLSTGKKVNSAIDNPSSYYTAQQGKK